MALTSGYTGLASFDVIITHCIIESVIPPTQSNVLHYIENSETQPYITWSISLWSLGLHIHCKWRKCPNSFLQIQ